MRFLPVNLDAVLVELEDLPQTLSLLASLQADPLEGIRELVPAARTLLVSFQPETLPLPRLLRDLDRRPLDRPPRQDGERVEIPVRYVGEDLDEVAGLLGLARDELIRRHTGSDYTVAFTGFAPGFAYLSGGHPSLDVPRRPTPRTRIPAGAVALAGRFSGVYPKASPGGWQIIGITTTPMWDLAREVPALLQPGARVRFVDVTGDARADMSGGDRPLPPSRERPAPPAAGPAGTAQAIQPLPSEAPAASPEGAARAQGAGGASADEAVPPGPVEATQAVRPQGAALEILRAGLLTSFQDLGRPGQAGQGVSASGAMDAGSLRAANRLVGNAAGSPALEITWGGFECRSQGDTVVAVTGAAVPVHLTDASGRRWPVATHQPLALSDGDRLSLGTPHQGVRSYLAVRGGFDVAPVLGSCATDTLAEVGPPLPRAGSRLPVRPPAGPAVVGGPELAPPALPAASDEVELDVLLGPRTDWFTEEAVALLTRQTWRVTPQSNRVGLRLHGAQPLARRITAELPSEGACWGAIQVPPSGQPVLFLADHPLTGGYPVIGAVATYHLDRAGQIPVGATVRFRIVRPFPLTPLTPPTPPADRPEAP